MHTIRPSSALQKRGGSNRSRRRPSQTADAGIALVGFGCRLPAGIHNAETLWSFLRDARCAIGDFPEARLMGETAAGRAKLAQSLYTRRGGFVGEAECFDAEFFGISPRDALHLDPQERMALQVAWEAIEDAAIDPLALAGSGTGVFVGSFANDYAQQDYQGSTVAELERYNPLAVLRGMLAGRLAYCLDLHGPALQLDTACSSSLVAVHLAAQSLQTGECDLAIAGGVNHLPSLRSFVPLCRVGVLSRTGACRTLDASADGYVRAEGWALVVLKRHADALRDGDQIYGVIRGSAMNHDGRSNGPSAPNGLAQEAVIRSALRRAQVDPVDVSYVELHGTGTVLGDPIEVNALGRVYGFRPKQAGPLYLGSVKTNLGHAESAAGVCGLMKAALALQHGIIPPHLHLQNLNPGVAWRELPFAMTERTVVLDPDRPRVAGVSGFGMTGTNVHLVVQAPSRRRRARHKPPPDDTARPAVLTLAAKTKDALSRMARIYHTWLVANPEISFADVCFTTNVGRAHFEHRLAIVAVSAVDAVGKLHRFLNGEPAEGMWTGSAAANTFPGTRLIFAAGKPESKREDLAEVRSDEVILFDGGFGRRPEAGGRLAQWLGDCGLGPVETAPQSSEDSPELAWLPLSTGERRGPGASSPVIVRVDREEDGIPVPPDSDVPASLGSDLAAAAAQAYVAGAPVVWRKLAGSTVWRLNGLPTYPFELRRYGLSPETAPTVREPELADEASVLVRRLASAEDGRIRFGLRRDGAELAWMHGHQVQGETVVAGTTWLSLVAAAAQRLTGDAAVQCEEVEFTTMLRLSPEHEVDLAFERNGAPDRFGFAISAQVGREPGAAETRCCRGRLVPVDGTRPAGELPGENSACTAEVSPETLYGLIERGGVTLGEDFRRLRTIRQGAGVATATLAARGDAVPDGLAWPPAILESALQLINVACDRDWAVTYVPVRIDRVRLFAAPAPARELWLSASARAKADGSGFVGDVIVGEQDGGVVAELRGIVVQKIGRATQAGTPDPVRVRAENSGGDRSQPAGPGTVPRVCAVVAAVLDMPAAELKPDRRLVELGVDSITLIEITERLMEEFGVDLPTAAVMEARTAAGIAALLQSRSSRAVADPNLSPASTP